MKVYGDNSLRLRAAKLAARPKCGVEWNSRDYLYSFGWGERTQIVHLHRCRRNANHAYRECVCHCGATKRKAVKR